MAFFQNCEWDVLLQFDGWCHGQGSPQEEWGQC